MSDTLTEVITKEQLNTWPEVVEKVNTCNGVAVVTMETLRDIDGYGRLGGTVRANIQKKLATIGLGTIREELPSDGAAPLLIYRLGTPVSNLIDMIKSIQAGSKDALHVAEALRSFNAMPNVTQVQDAVTRAFECLTEAVNSLSPSTS